MKTKLFKIDSNKIRILSLLLLVFSTNVFSESFISRNLYLQERLFASISMKLKGNCLSRSLEGRYCEVDFMFISANSNIDPINYGSVSLSYWINAGVGFNSSGPIISSHTPNGVEGFVLYSMDDTGKIRDLLYRKGSHRSNEQFLDGYYAIRSPKGFYWSAYLYNDDNISGPIWGKVDDPQHPWQVCSASDSFSRERGCYDSSSNNISYNLSVDADFTVHRDGQLGNDVTWVIEKNGQIVLQRWAKNELKYKYDGNAAGSNFRIWLKEFINGQYEVVSNIVQYNVSQSEGNPTTEASIFDGAGSIIDANTDCYGCDKDTAVMHPHNNANSTVVFQWLHNPSRCDNLIVTAVDESNERLEPPLAVEIKSKGWNSQTIQSAYKTQISNTTSQPLRLTKQDSWTTIAVTSSQPVDKKIWVTARCEEPGDRLPGPTRTTIEKTPVALSRGANWMGTGSLISTASRSADGGAYGVVQDLAIGSDNSKAVTSLQWLSSEQCKSLKLEDGNAPEASRNIKVSMKLWNDAVFTQQACNSLPCDISAYADNTTYNYYVLKVESNAGILPSGIRAVCQQ